MPFLFDRMMHANLAPYVEAASLVCLAAIGLLALYALYRALRGN